MIWLLRDIDLLTVLLRAGVLAFEALLLGGVAYLLAVARPARACAAVKDLCRQGIRIAALGLVTSEVALLLASGALLMSGSDLTLGDVTTTNFFRAGSFAILFTIGLWICARMKSSKAAVAMFPLGLLLLMTTVSTSHAVARIDHRVLLAILTAAHHLGTAAWLGAMPYLWISLGRVEDADEGRRLAERYSLMALLGVTTLVSLRNEHGRVVRRNVEQSKYHCVWHYVDCQDLPSIGDGCPWRRELVSGAASRERP